MTQSAASPVKRVDDAPAAAPGPVTLEGRFGRVEKFDPVRHGASLWRMLHGHDSIWTYMWYGPFGERARFDEFLSKLASLPDPYAFAIVDKTGNALGVATLMEVRPKNRVIEVGGIFYAPSLQRTPLATEAQYLLARYVFEELRYRRYEWKCDALNLPSRRAAERFGFSYEGTFSQHMIVKGKNRDTAWFAMLDSEWPRVKRAFEQWLSADNFDGAGRQKQKLESLRA